MKLAEAADVMQPDITDAIAFALQHLRGRSEAQVTTMVLATADEVEAELGAPANREAIRRCAEHLMAHKTIKGDNVDVARHLRPQFFKRSAFFSVHHGRVSSRA